ncbi:MAG: hypothetical protein C0609_00220 [Deltaproteobacteria bacterium]|nr:MAG: hypothetical protein C0609_00220 [Deltaproteobacteria bacterium]
MELDIAEWGLPALFIVSFVAATLAPVGSEWLLAVIILRGGDPVPAVLVASSGNFLGALTTYGIGRWGGEVLERKGVIEDNVRYDRAESAFLRYGAWTLLLSWLPLVGDALCLVAGLFRVGIWRFTILTLTGKAARYAAVAAVLA